MTDGAEALAGRRGSAVDQIAERIGDLIRDRGLGVGDVLPPEAELAQMFGTSRNTVREAIRTLKAFGLIESRQKVGAVITDRRQAAVMDMFAFAIDLSAETFRDVQGFRRLVEINLIERLDPGRLPEALARMEASNDRMSTARQAGEAALHDYDFHFQLVAATGNRTLTEIYAMLKPVMLRMMEIGKAQRRGLSSSAVEHRAILDALKAGDRIAYAYHLSRHLEAGLEYIPAAKGGRG